MFDLDHKDYNIKDTIVDQRILFTPYETPVYDNYKNVFGGTLSAGFIPKLNIAITPFIEISYHMDFTNTYSGVNNKIKNNALEVCVGLILP